LICATIGINRFTSRSLLVPKILAIALLIKPDSFMVENRRRGPRQTPLLRLSGQSLKAEKPGAACSEEAYLAL
jgi:hypothetical protein